MKAALAVLLLLASDPGRARAVECRAIDGAAPELARIDAAQRLEFLRESLRRGAHEARVWAWGFGIGYATLAVGQVAISPAIVAEKRVDWWVGAGASTVGVLTLLIMPPKGLRDQRWLEARIAAAPPGTDPCALLADAERLLVRDAAPPLGNRALLHVGNLLFNLGVGLLQGLVWGHWTQGATTFAIGSSVGEVMLNTAPQDLPEALARYRAGNLVPVPPRRFQWGLAPSVAPGQYAIDLTFHY